MSPKDKKFMIGGLSVALIIAFLAPFLASSNPDGLESTEKQLTPGFEPEPAYKAFLPDYTVPAWGEESPAGGVFAIIVGTLCVFAVAWGIGVLFKKTKTKKDD